MNCRQYFAQWLELKRSELEVSTFEAYTIYVYRHIIPYFEEFDIEALNPLLIQKYVSDKLRNGRCDGSGGLSRTSVKKHLQIIREAFNDAVRYGMLPNNPANLVKLPKQRRGSERPIVFLDVEKAKELLSSFRDTRLYPVVLVTLFYGLRRSEVLGLTWSAVDFDANTISIIRTVVKNVSIVEKDTTKTDYSRRRYELLPDVRCELIRLKGAQEFNERFRKGIGLPYVKSDYIFIWEDGKLYRPDFLTRSFQRHLSRHGFPKMRFHDLRHSTASILFDRGWSLRDVQEWLGHADISTTSDIYVHYGRDRKKLVGKDLSGIFSDEE